MTWGLLCLVGLLADSPARADAGLSALPFWPAAPMVIATTLGSGLAGMAVKGPKLALELAAGGSSLPRVRLLPADQQAFLLVAPPLGSRFAVPGRMPQPPGIEIEHGPRLLVLTPDIRMTNDRRGAFLGLRGTF